MPTYDYKCQACGHAFEKFQPITARAVRKCPRCGRWNVKRLIGAGAGIIFRGSGFYQTDYRTEAYRKAAEKDKPSSAKDKPDKAGKKGDTGGKKADKTGGARGGA